MMSGNESGPVPAGQHMAVIRNARIRGTHPCSFRSGEWAEILGARVCKPLWMDERIAFECRYPDGVLDYIAVSDSDNYEIGM